MYRVYGYTKHVEEDVYDEGCDPDTAIFMQFNDSFSDLEQSELVSLLMIHVGLTPLQDDENVLINACDTPGRVDIQTLENSNGDIASEFEQDEWKEGRCRLWDTTYSFCIVRVEPTTEPIEKGQRNFSTN